MTRPIYEPNPQRATASLDFGEQQLFRRPAPRGANGLPYCYMRWVGSGTTVTDTLFNVTTDSDYEETFIYDPAGQANFSLDATSGCVGWQFPGEYFVSAGVQWNGTGSDTFNIGAVLDRGTSCSFSSDRTANVIVADNVNENMWIPVHRMYTDFNGNITFRVLVYHGGAPANDIGAVWIHVVQMNPNVDGVFGP